MKHEKWTLNIEIHNAISSKSGITDTLRDNVLPLNHT